MGLILLLGGVYGIGFVVCLAQQKSPMLSLLWPLHSGAKICAWVGKQIPGVAPYALKLETLLEDIWDKQRIADDTK